MDSTASKYCLLVKVLHPTPHKIVHFGDVPQANLLAWYGNKSSAVAEMGYNTTTPQPLYGPFFGTTQVSATSSGLTSAHLHHPPHIFYRPDALPAAHPRASKH